MKDETMTRPVLRIENLCKSFGTTPVVTDVSFDVNPSEVIVIIGSSGTGKSTLLQCLNLLHQPTSGRIFLEDQEITASGVNQDLVRRQMGMVFQEFNLFNHLTVLGNMTLALRKVLKKEKDRAEEEARAMLGRLGIGQLGESFPSQISRGQAQRAAIARALILNPKYLLLDEPTSALDINTADEFGRWLVELKQYTTFVIVTHDIRFAGKVVTSGVVFSRGEVRLEGGIEDLVHDIETMPDVWEGN